MVNRIHGLTGRPTYISWESMLGRCHGNDPHRTKNYGQRGIKVCEMWLIFANFLADMGERPAGTSLDRYPNVDGNYEPGNCRWATKAEQSRNRRNNCHITHNGATKTAADWAEELGMSQKTIARRIREGMTPEQALTPPRTTRYIQHDGKRMTPTEWAKFHGWEDGIVLRRLRRGWSEIDAVTIPPGTYKNQWDSGAPNSYRKERA